MTTLFNYAIICQFRDKGFREKKSFYSIEEARRFGKNLKEQGGWTRVWILKICNYLKYPEEYYEEDIE